MSCFIKPAPDLFASNLTRARFKPLVTRILRIKSPSELFIGVIRTTANSYKLSFANHLRGMGGWELGWGTRGVGWGSGSGITTTARTLGSEPVDFLRSIYVLLSSSIALRSAIASRGCR